MIQTLSLKNFRNFDSKEISLLAGKNIIIGNNGFGKSNILEALSLPNVSLVESNPAYLLAKGSDLFFLRYTLDSGDMSVSYSHDTRTKKFLLSGKSTTKKKFREHYPHVISFHPIIMNMMYLQPTERRNFLDSTLIQAFPEYEKNLSEYKKIVTNRNRLLKHISEGKSSESELSFWNDAFIDTATRIYSYREKIITHMQQNIASLLPYFFGKVTTLEFRYISKTDWNSPASSLQEYISNNTQKELLLRKTLRGPHLDDFDILVDGIPLVHYASRGEVKSSILGLKFLETAFIETHASEKDVLFLVDDLLSELDSEHQEILWKHIGDRQSVITAIGDIGIPGNTIYL